MNTGCACWNWGWNYDVPIMPEAGEAPQTDCGYAGCVFCRRKDHGRPVRRTHDDDLSEFDNWLYGFEMTRKFVTKRPILSTLIHTKGEKKRYERTEIVNNPEAQQSQCGIP